MVLEVQKTAQGGREAEDGVLVLVEEFIESQCCDRGRWRLQAKHSLAERSHLHLSSAERCGPLHLDPDLYSS